MEKKWTAWQIVAVTSVAWACVGAVVLPLFGRGGAAALAPTGTGTVQTPVETVGPPAPYVDIDEFGHFVAPYVYEQFGQASADVEAARRVKRLGAQLASAATNGTAFTNFLWGKYSLSFELLADRERAMAVAVPPGTIVLTERMLEMCKDDAELEWILAVTIGHLERLRSGETRDQIEATSLGQYFLHPPKYIPSDGHVSFQKMCGYSAVQFLGIDWDPRAEDLASRNAKGLLDMQGRSPDSVVSAAKHLAERLAADPAAKEFCSHVPVELWTRLEPEPSALTPKHSSEQKPETPEKPAG